MNQMLPKCVACPRMAVVMTMAGSMCAECAKDYPSTVEKMKPPESAVQKRMGRLKGSLRAGRNRNGECPCGSGKKVKKCCGSRPGNDV